MTETNKIVSYAVTYNPQQDVMILLHNFASIWET